MTNEGLEPRVRRLEDQMSDVRLTLVKLEGDMTTNNRMTAEIRDNTAEIVTLAKAFKLFGQWAAWLGAMSALVAFVMALLK